MEILLSILSNEAVFNLLSNGILLGVSAIMGRFALTQEREAQVRKAKDAIAAGVADLYPVVKALKAASATGKLSNVERTDLQVRALNRAMEIGKNAGVDVMKTLGPTVARSILEQTVSSLKSGSKKEVVLRPDTAALLPSEPPVGWATSPKATD